jgi:hypothetical protein
MADVRQDMVAEIAAKLGALGVPATYGQGADVIINGTFIDAAWSMGKKKITFEASVLLDPLQQKAFMWQLTRESSQGFSFGFQSESWSQRGKTLYRKVKATQYGLDGKAYEYNLDLGAITKAVEETVKRFGWRFETVLSREKASYPPGQISSTFPSSP